MLKASVFVFLLAFLSSPMAKADLSYIEVHGHRGSRGHLPENTLPAFDYAIQHGADYLEMDMAVTKDGVIVISHDPHMNSDICLDPKGQKITTQPLIHDLTLAEVKKFDCGTLKNPRFNDQTPIPGTRVPTLEEVFALVKGSKDPNAKRIRFNIETKVFPDHPEYTIDPKEFSEKAVAAFKKSGFYDRIILQSFDPRTLVEGKKIDPKLVTVLLVEDPKMDMIAEAKKINANIISPDFTLLNADLVEKMHQAHFQVVPWTVNEEKDWASLVQMKVDGIISDYCDRVIAYLEKTGHRDAKAKKAHFAFF